MPSTSSFAGTWNVTFAPAAVPDRGAAVAYVFWVIVPVGRFARPSSTPFRYSTTPSSAITDTVPSFTVDAPVTVNDFRNWALSGLVARFDGSMFVATVPPRPSTAAPLAHDDASNPTVFQFAGHASAEYRHDHDDPAGTDTPAATGAAAVVVADTDAGVDDTPAADTADTVYEYAVDAVNPVSVNDVVGAVTVPTFTPLRVTTYDAAAVVPVGAAHVNATDV